MIDCLLSAQCENVKKWVSGSIPPESSMKITAGAGRLMQQSNPRRPRGRRHRRHHDATLTIWSRLPIRIGVLENHLYFLKLKCTNCHDEFPSPVGISRDMEVEGIKGRALSRSPLHP